MRKALTAILSLALVTFAPALGALGAEETFEWRLQTVDVPSATNYNILQRFAANVEQASGGRLKINIFGGGELVGAMEIPEALKKGAIEIAYSYMPYYPGLLPEANISPASLPFFLWTDPIDPVIMNEFMGLKEIIGEALAEIGIRNYPVNVGGDAGLWSTKPIRSIKDFEGAKIRASGMQGKFFELVGAVTVRVPHAEGYTALATGVLDAYTTSTHLYEQMKLYEHAPYLYKPVSPLADGNIMVSIKAWDTLPDDLKALLEMGIKTANFDIFFENRWEADQLFAKAENELGATIITLPEEEIDEWREKSLPLLDEIAAQSPRNAKGIQLWKDYLKMRGYLD